MTDDYHKNQRSSQAFQKFINYTENLKNDPAFATEMRWFRRITRDEYDKKLQEIKDKQYRLGIELDEHTKADHEYHIHVATVLHLAQKTKEIFQSSEVHEKRSLLNFLLQNPTVEGRKLNYSLKIPFNSILELAQNPTCTNGLCALVWYESKTGAEPYFGLQFPNSSTGLGRIF